MNHAVEVFDGDGIDRSRPIGLHPDRPIPIKRKALLNTSFSSQPITIVMQDEEESVDFMFKIKDPDKIHDMWYDAEGTIVQARSVFTTASTTIVGYGVQTRMVISKWSDQAFRLLPESMTGEQVWITESDLRRVFGLPIVSPQGMGNFIGTKNSPLYVDGVDVEVQQARGMLERQALWIRLSDRTYAESIIKRHTANIFHLTTMSKTGGKIRYDRCQLESSQHTDDGDVKVTLIYDKMTII